MVKKLIPVFLLCTVVIGLRAQQQPLQADAEGSLVKWMTLKEAMEKEKLAPRPIIMDFYTDWCGWCKQMMRTTYAGADLATYINNNYYPVKFNAETKDTVEYLGKKYGPVGSGRSVTNELAIKLMQNKLLYPTTLFLNNYDKAKDEFGFSMLAQGYLENKKIEPMLIFVLENVFRSSNFEDFKEKYETAFYDTSTDTKLKKLKWLTPKEGLDRKESSKKKTIVLINTEWCNGCRVMKRTSFIDTATEKYVLDKFDLVDFNPDNNDSIHYKGQTFYNPHTQQMPFHQLAFALCKNSMTLPTMVVLDEQMNIVDAIPFYIHPSVLKNILKFYGDDVYKKKSWKDFMAEINPPKKEQ